MQGNKTNENLKIMEAMLPIFSPFLVEEIRKHFQVKLQFFGKE